MSNYDDKVQREQAWYKRSGFQQSHFLNSRLFFSPERAAFTTVPCKRRFARSIQEVLDRDHFPNPRILIAPTGAGNDLPYLLPLSNRITGIDISADAIKAIAADTMEKHVGDIKHMTMFEDGQFDLVIMSQFFHHFLSFGFEEFLQEGRRVLRPGGHFFAFEPSILHPFAFAACCGKKLFGNISGCVEDESPFLPRRLTQAMRRCGFRDVAVSAASYSHHRMPVPLARLVHSITFPLLRAPLLKHFAYYCVFYGRKPE
jgi:SAM-dependent methyltransferase